MLMPSGQFRVFVSMRPLDMRAGIDRIAAICKAELGMNPHGGAVFVFFSRDRTRAKVYYFDGSGSCLFLKRLERGRFKPPSSASKEQASALPANELALLLDGIDLSEIKRPKGHWLPDRKEKPEKSPPHASFQPSCKVPPHDDSPVY